MYQMHACNTCREDVLKIKAEIYIYTHMDAGEALSGKQYFIQSAHPRMFNSGSSLSHQSASFHPGTA